MSQQAQTGKIRHNESGIVLHWRKEGGKYFGFLPELGMTRGPVNTLEVLAQWAQSEIEFQFNHGSM